MNKPGPGTLLALGVAALFTLMACAWTAMFFFAGKARVESVPMAAPVRAETAEAR